jgi:uncharacterized membrane protein
MRRMAWIIIGMFLLSAWVTPPSAGTAVVHAVLFFSPSCVHCHKVMTEDLPPLQEKYGNQLQIQEIDISTSEGQSVYLAAVNQFNISGDRQGVPTMILGDVVMVGEQEIPDQLPLLIENGLKAGGVDWPNIEGLAALITTAGPVSTPAPSGLSAKIMRDPLGNSISIAVLVGIVFVYAIELIRAPWQASGRKRRTTRAVWRKWTIPVLAIFGLGVAAYMTFVEVTSTEAICGPVGDCNSVQSSEYARIFGILPVGLFGLMGYAVILVAWGLKEFAGEKFAMGASIALMLLTTFGILFSIYLTFLEPFVIGATCAWCLSSALLMTGLYWVSFETARDMVKPQPVRRGHGKHGGKK